MGWTVLIALSISLAMSAPKSIEGPKPGELPRAAAARSACSGGAGTVTWDAGAAPRRPETADGRSATRAYRDPTTGRFTVPPPGSPDRRPPVTRLKDARQPLVEVPVRGLAGGFRVSLGGRFLRFVTVSRDASGRTALRCGTTPEDRPGPVPGSPQAPPGEGERGEGGGR